ncbi:HAMP domain-containing protein [Paenibacillus albicereus]|uniref:histidine kinase n=1 Tax=Paenibacillus albicereus TaxID=2726185 RepID=A0A6H2GZ11_9BACL|nr:ATP-binding protein [Paenibacillus albicereus]QJC52673.1 HAMP domain-containing protein [Paenibacillus albicereus]
MTGGREAGGKKGGRSRSRLFRQDGLHGRLTLLLLAFAALVLLLFAGTVLAGLHVHVGMYEREMQLAPHAAEPSLSGHLERAIAESVLWTLLGSVLIAAGIAYFAAGRLARPLVRMKEAAADMERGAYSARVHAEGPAELAELAASMNGLAARLQQQEQLRRRMSENIAHELRTPLATLGAALRAMEDGVWEATPERLAASCAEVRRLSRLVEELEKLNDYGRPEFRLEPSLHAAGRLLAEAAAGFEARCAAAGIQLRLEPVPEGWTIIADAVRVGQILHNLLDNAVKHTPPGGGVVLRAARGKRMLALIVEDEGCGIPEEDLPHVFERFYRARQPASPFAFPQGAGSGSGLGLAIARQLAEAHGGSLRAERSSAGGARMTLELPLPERPAVRSLG